MSNLEHWTLIIRLCTLIVLIGISIMLADALPFLTHAARIYVSTHS